MAIIAVMFASCTNSNVKEDIKEYKNQQVENISVKEVNIENEFYNYTQEYHHSVDLLFDNIDRLVKAEVRSKHSYGGDKALYEKQYEKYKNYEDSLKIVIDNFEMTSQRGTIYVAKYKGFNKFGKKDGFYSFGVFTYNKDGSIHQYEGMDCMDLVLTAYPDAMKEAGKALKPLKQAFGV